MKKYLFAVVLLTIAVYYPVLKNEFVVPGDDSLYLTNNDYIKSFSAKNIVHIFSLESIRNYELYHPITILSYMFEYAIWGTNPAGYHAVNIILHIINVLLVYWFVYILKPYIFREEQGGEYILLISSLLFAVHPVNVQAVAWISGRKELLSALFCLSGIISYIYYRQSKRKKYLTGAYAACLLALLSKPNAVVFPVALILVDYVIEKKITLKTILRIIPFIVVGLAVTAINMYAQYGVTYCNNYKYSGIDRIFFPGYILVFNLFKILMPVKLSVFYPEPHKSGVFLPFVYYLYSLIAVFVVILIFHLRKKYSHFFFGSMFYLVFTLPVVQIIPRFKDNITADNYSYLPAIGIFCFLAVIMNNIINAGRYKKVVLLVFMAVVIFLSCMTYTRCGVWKNTETYNKDVFAKYPDTAYACIRRGDASLTSDNFDEAVQWYEKALKIEPCDYITYMKLGYLYAVVNDYEKALVNYGSVIALKPGITFGYIKRAEIYKNTGMYALAIADYDKIINLNPNSSIAHNIRGNLYFMMEKYDEAIRDYDKAIKLNSSYDESYNNRGFVNYILKKYGEAERDFNKAVEINPKYALAYNNRGKMFLDRCEYEKALKDFEKAIELSPDNIEAYQMAAEANRSIGNTKKAEYFEKKAKELKTEKYKFLLEPIKKINQK